MSNQTIVNQLVSLPFTSEGLVTGKTAFTNVLTLRDGEFVTNPSYSFVEAGAGLYLLRFTPVTTGLYEIFIEGAIQIRFEVVTRTLRTLVENIEDEALGSWKWDKKTGELVLLRQNSTELATFKVVDDLIESSRERLT